MDPAIVRQSRILIVDDQQANAALMERVLRQAGFTQFTSLHDSREVIDQLRTFRPDLIVLDLMMPHVDGFAVMKQLRGFTPDETYLPILVITADASKTAREKALSLGAKDFLTKPIDTTEATLRVYNLLQTRWLYGQAQAKSSLLVELISESQKGLASISSEFDRLAASGTPASQLAPARACLAHAEKNIDRIRESAEKIQAGQFAEMPPPDLEGESGRGSSKILQ